MSNPLGFKGLDAWQKSMDLVELIYRVTKTWPDEERFGLTNQVRRAAVSIPSTIAEGYGRQSTGDFLRFVAIAYGSLSEVETQSLIAKRLEYLSESDSAKLITQCESVGQVIQGFSRYLRKQSQSSSSHAIGETPDFYDDEFVG